MTEGIKSFLESAGMIRHFDMFITRGYDDEADISHLNETDLYHIGITDPSEIVHILKAANDYIPSKEYKLYSWLRDNGLVHYYEGFVQSEIIDLDSVSRLNLPDEDVYDELEITLPGHQRRLERAVCSLRKQLNHLEMKDRRITVAEGWWGFPQYLQNAKYPFLCVQATIRSTVPQTSCSQSMEFMVDSGSDVSTMREHIIQELGLEPIGPVQSCGVFGSQRTIMYRAQLTLGDQHLEIEVISSSYDSLGSRVLRHFHHQIDGVRHVWLRGSSQNSGVRNLNVLLQQATPPTANAQPETISVFSTDEMHNSRVTPQSSQEDESGVSEEVDAMVVEDDKTDTVAVEDDKCVFNHTVSGSSYSTGYHYNENYIPPCCSQIPGTSQSTCLGEKHQRTCHHQNLKKINNTGHDDSVLGTRCHQKHETSHMTGHKDSDLKASHHQNNSSCHDYGVASYQNEVISAHQDHKFYANGQMSDDPAIMHGCQDR